MPFSIILGSVASSRVASRVVELFFRARQWGENSLKLPLYGQGAYTQFAPVPYECLQSQCHSIVYIQSSDTLSTLFVSQSLVNLNMQHQRRSIWNTQLQYDQCFRFTHFHYVSLHCASRNFTLSPLHFISLNFDS